MYPNLDPLAVAKISAEAVRSSKVVVKGIHYRLLAIYLLSVLGAGELNRIGLGGCVPRRKKQDTNSRSLLNSRNKDLAEWDTDNLDLDENNKKHMLAVMVQIMVLLISGSTCYRFGGRIFKQQGGLGIGLRASAALARVCMCVWDDRWADIQKSWGLLIILFKQ